MNPFELLGISPDASKQEISAAFRQKAKDCHPDLNPSDKGAKERFILLQKAYEDAVARLASNPGKPEAQRPKKTMRTVRREVVLGVLDAVRGKTVHLSGASGQCRGCAGDGHLRSTHAISCSTCGGSGISGYKERGIIRVKTSCPDCAGSGRTTKIVCAECGGFGSMPTADLAVDIPPGCRDGDVFTVSGGASEPDRGIDGDLEIVVRVKNGDGYRIVRDDIEKDIEIQAWEAVLGGEISVDAPDGRRFKLSVPAGSQVGRRFRLKGQGYAGAGSRGDFVAVLCVTLPHPADPKVRRAFEKLRDDLS